MTGLLRSALTLVGAAPTAFAGFVQKWLSCYACRLSRVVCAVWQLTERNLQYEELVVLGNS